MKYKGFTLIELLVVIAIIGMLASIVLVSLKGIREKGTIAKGKSLYSQIAHVLGVEARGIWRFEESAGPALDSSGYNNNGTWNNVQSKTAAECGLDLGKCLYFNGSASVYIASSPSLSMKDQVTVSAWVYYLGSPSWRNYFGNYLWAANYLFVLSYHNNCKGWFMWYGSYPGSSFCFGNDLRDQWVHIAVTYDNSLSSANIKTYENGVAMQTRNYTGIAIPDSNNALVIGSGVDSRFWNGYIDEVLIYASALTAGEVQRLYAESAKRHHVASVPGI
jgi:MSHA biogenesis protein MshQ